MPNQSPYTTNNPAVGNEEGPAAKIVVGEVTYTDSDAKYKDAGEPGIFADYSIVSRYERDRHTYMMGITSPNGFQGKSAAFVQLASPTLLWIVDWTACKTGGRPNIPDPQSANSNWILLDDWYEPGELTVGPDGVTPVYRISGTYVYGNVNPSSQPTADLSFPRPPWLEDTFARDVPQTLLEQGLSDRGGGETNLSRVNPGDLSRVK